MSHLETELSNLKKDLGEMFAMVISQLEKSQSALFNIDKDLAREVVANERRVNSFELKLDRDCENIIALFNPVAVDLRLVLAALKINSNLERIGDIAEGIAKYVKEIQMPLDADLLKTTELEKMYTLALQIMSDVMMAFEKEDTKLARSVFEKDEKLDALNAVANTKVIEFISSHSDMSDQALHVISTIRKLERVGDQCKNIAEEIIFYLEAKVLKHRKGIR